MSLRRPVASVDMRMEGSDASRLRHVLLVGMSAKKKHKTLPALFEFIEFTPFFAEHANFGGIFVTYTKEIQPGTMKDSRAFFRAEGPISINNKELLEKSWRPVASTDKLLNEFNTAVQYFINKFVEDEDEKQAAQESWRSMWLKEPPPQMQP